MTKEIQMTNAEAKTESAFLLEFIVWISLVIGH
jgi:hypothetical protein